ncbi:ABC transporter substrate-binding protein [Bacillus vallismortis]|uniref:ABC transporter substrate-binding protein n=1 Tax=Bacillus vallismortis TaxID=72361 RepID=UPI002281C44B|nr:ABC transporter substrate-binding protein [Bacillus vallismortis]MCY7916598.1 ABC transporter substrate-binding protein [Bacillus vallismortis]MCY8532339.1 ABC transporter substrate-binding protein [Bacillus vallismortis]MCY8544908.1 ABC transporter substrate-binding protein [Bacillus vallismortis]
MKRALIMLTVLLLFVLTAACSSSGNQNSKGHNVAVTHDLGKTNVPEHPKRVVVLELGFIDTLLDLGITPVGVADDNKAKQLINEEVLKNIEGYTSVGTRSQPSMEKIASLKPDLIIADTTRHKKIYDQLKKIAPTIALDNLNADYQDTIDVSLTIAKAVGKEKEMEKKLTVHEEKLNETKREISAKGETVLLIGNTNDTIMARDENFFTSRLLTQVGYQYAISTSDNNESSNGGDSVNMKMTLEQLLKTDPDVIILMTGKTDDIDADGKRPIEKNVLWKKLKAVKNGHVYHVDRAVWSLRRSVDGADAILDELQQEMR